MSALDLSHIMLQRSVPAQVLNMQKNQLSGGLPEVVLLNCVRLRDLRLWQNRLTGSVGSEVGSLKHLEVRT